MPSRRILLCVLALVVSFTPRGTPAIDVGAYTQFLASTRDWETAQILASREPFGPYRDGVGGKANDPRYLADVDRWLHLTAGEQALLKQHGFVISERWRTGAFAPAFEDIHARDLPVFVSTDAILHAVHKSYDDLLIDAEVGYMINAVGDALTMMRGKWPAMNARYGQDPRMRANLADVDVYITVALRLLYPSWGVRSQGGNDAFVEQILQLVAAEQPAEIALFEDTPRTYDFSQMKPRGHYVNEQIPELADYFRAMMWLGRTEFRLSDSVEITDPSREILDARLLLELARDSGARESLDAVDQIIRGLVGPPDNVTPAEMDSVCSRIGVDSADDLLDPVTREAFDAELRTGACTPQAILSQILSADLMHPELLDPPFAFLLMGQRFVIDSYVTGDVVWPSVPVQNPDTDRPRLLPDPLDVLYCLGNDDALPLLKGDLDLYKYAPNLAALRYLVDDQEPEFWHGALYNAWLHAIGTLSKTGRQDGAPAFMKTGAWQQEKMNTQLAAWAELRHDNLLYAKQSYSGEITCSFPCTYIEPVPEFYRSLSCFAERAADAFGVVPGMNGGPRRFFLNLQSVMTRLEGISEKELSCAPFTEDEKAFLRAVLYEHEETCAKNGQLANGWYAQMFYISGQSSSEDALGEDLLVADVHTDPTYTRVLHVATGDPDLGIFVAPGEEGIPTAFVGPVAAYHEYVTTGFRRLTDDEWAALYRASAPTRPDWTNVYLADRLGQARAEGRRLATIPDTLTAEGGLVHTVQDPEDQDAASAPAIAFFGAAPTPFSDATLISFRVGGADRLPVRLCLYDAQGRLVRELVDRGAFRGFTTVRWDGSDQAGRKVAPGAYYARLSVGTLEATRKLLIVR